MKIYVSAIFLVCLVFSCKNENLPGWIDNNRIINRDAKEWVTLGGDYMQQHYSPLEEINTTNVGNLGFAWEFDARSVISRVPHGLEATPIVVDGIMYTSGAWGFVYAVNAKTGEGIWTYDPKVDASYNRRACCDVVNRGVAVWKGKIYVGTLDGYLVCLDAKDGHEIWRSDTFIDRTLAYTITAAPQVAGKVVVIGNSGAEYGVRGYITAYNLDSGEQEWRFYTVPGDPNNEFEHEEMEMASKTWDPNSNWEVGGGGTVWGQSAYDPELNLLYIGTGNSSPYPIWIRSPEGGDNLFLASILAINPNNGKLIWYYQTTPGEIWDYTATQNIVLANISWKGEERKVLMQAPKNGFFYVLDRKTGELLSAEKYTVANWASHIDIKTGRPVLTEQGWYKDEPKLVLPGIAGGHNWNPMSYNPKTGLVYIPEIVFPMIYKFDENYAFQKLKFGTGLVYESIFSPPFPKESRKYFAGQSDTIEVNKLKAWDPINQQMKWEYLHEVPKGNGGILSTAGDLTFQGTNTGFLKIFEANSGELLKEIEVGTGIIAAPMSYKIDGEQYVAVMAGYGGNSLAWGPSDKRVANLKYQNYGRLLAFKLGGGSTPLPPKFMATKTPAPPSFEIDKALVIKGEALFNGYCKDCHRAGSEIEYSQYPNLAKLLAPTHNLFKKIVLEGVFAQNGMDSFADVLNEDDVDAIQHYLVKQQTDLFEEQSNPGEN